MMVFGTDVMSMLETALSLAPEALAPLTWRLQVRRTP
jgi:hypothetical protein